MILQENPFYILGATLRDNKKRILELADDRSLVLDPEICNIARGTLTNPRRRLPAEISWFLDLSPQKTKQWLELIENKKSDLIKVFIAEYEKRNTEGFTGLSKIDLANLASNLLILFDVSLSKYPEEALKSIIVNLSMAFDNIKSEEVLNSINENRIASGFPEIIDIDLIEEELKILRCEFRRSIKIALDRLISDKIISVVTEIVDLATSEGQNNAPLLIEDMVDDYATETQLFLNQEEENIKKILEKLEKAAEEDLPINTIDSIIQVLATVVKNWDRVAQPIQVSFKSRGLNHEASIRIWRLTRETSLQLFNNHSLLIQSKKITDLMGSVFAEVMAAADRIKEDKAILNEIHQDKEGVFFLSDKNSEKWQSDIACSIYLFKDDKVPFSISPMGIVYKGNLTPFKDIKNLAWGAVMIPSWGFMIAWWGVNKTIPILNTIFLDDSAKFEFIVERIWKAVGIEILINQLRRLSKGEELPYGLSKGEILVKDDGIKFNIAPSGEPIFYKWEDLSIWNEDGDFIIQSTKESKHIAQLPYFPMGNIVLLSKAINTLFDKDKSRLSDLLGD